MSCLVLQPPANLTWWIIQQIFSSVSNDTQSLHQAEHVLMQMIRAHVWSLSRSLSLWVSDPDKDRVALNGPFDSWWCLLQNEQHLPCRAATTKLWRPDLSWYGAGQTKNTNAVRVKHNMTDSCQFSMTLKGSKEDLSVAKRGKTDDRNT